MNNNKKDFNFWQDHSVNYLEMAFSHIRRETVANPDGYGIKKRECGDTVEMFLTIENDRIKSVAFALNGCIHSNACSNTIAHLAENKTIIEAAALTPEDVINFLETLPENEYHCAVHAVDTLLLALNNYKSKG